MDNRELLNKLIELEIKKIDQQELLDRENDIKHDKDNINEKVFSLGQIDEKNENQIERNISLLYQQYPFYYEFIYQQIKVLDGVFHKKSNDTLIAILNQKIINEKGDNLEDKILNYFIFKKLSNSKENKVKRDFFYIIYILQYDKKEIVFNHIRNKIIKFKENSMSISNDKNGAGSIEQEIESLKNSNLLLENKIRTCDIVVKIFGDHYFTSRINLIFTIIFFVLKYKYDFDIGIKIYGILISIGIITQFLILSVYDFSKHKKMIEKNEEFIRAKGPRMREINFKKYLDENYINSLNDFIID